MPTSIPLEPTEAPPGHPSAPCGGTTSYAAPHIAELFAGAGRAEDAVAVLEQHASANSHDLAGYLIDLGRIEDALAVLQRRSPGRPSCRTDLGTTIPRWLEISVKCWESWVGVLDTQYSSTP
ncbi:tetratricopeptide repeat protein [Streptomyces sp. AcE210]|uniref:tetratricopeptide repeat protein n=1 Tax=Streptomyces sp. AcE210 TaxID=2292703 RepID=UPI000E30AC16|nr:tetratricopeptide repeat protein [Streptomyces sp. AcE210]RFC78078.1 tetratricopeptide repeat protein [Streptomyces sp. AcE210]